MATGILYLNGVDAETIGFSPVNASGLLGSAAKTLGLLSVPGVPGGIDPGVAASEATRRIAITGLISASSYSTLYTTLDAIKQACQDGLVEIRSAYSSTRAFYGVLEPFDAEQQAGLSNPFVDGYALFTVSFLCPVPYAIALTPTVVNFRSTATSVPIGTAPSAGRDNWTAYIEIAGAATTPVITYANYRGDTVSTITVSGYSPLAGDSVLIDCGRRQIWKFVSGVRSNLFSSITAGYDFPAFDPADADVANALYPTLTCSSGSANVRLFRHWR